MALNLVVYDPPIAGFPYLAVAVETDAPVDVLYAEAHATLAEAEAAIFRMAARLEEEQQAEQPVPRRRAGGA